MSDLWTEASRDFEAEQRLAKLAAVQSKVVPLRAFLAGSANPADYLNRKEVVRPRIEAAVMEATGDLDADLLRDIEAALDTDYAILHEARVARRVVAESERRVALRKRAEGESGGQTCTECGAAIERDPAGEEPRTWHHADGSSHDHEAKPAGGESKEGRRVQAEGGQTCATCGDSITRDPEGEEPRTWHHTSGEKHDHEAKPKSEGEAKEAANKYVVDEYDNDEVSASHEYDTVEEAQAKAEEVRGRGKDYRGRVKRDEGGKFTSSKTAGRYCKTHQVWVGSGNADSHDGACKIEERATEAAKTARMSIKCNSCGHTFATNDRGTGKCPKCSSTDLKRVSKTAAEFPVNSGGMDAGPLWADAPGPESDHHASMEGGDTHRGPQGTCPLCTTSTVVPMMPRGRRPFGTEGSKDTYIRVCPECDGTGKVEGRSKRVACSRCDGTGKVQQSKLSARQAFVALCRASFERSNWNEKFEAMRKGAPFAGYEDFDACVRANSDKDDPEAYCGKIKHQVEDKKEGSKTAAREGWCVYDESGQIVAGPFGESDGAGSAAAGKAYNNPGKRFTVGWGTVEDKKGSVEHASARLAGESYHHRVCPSCGRRVRVQLGQDFPEDHAKGCKEQADFPGRDASRSVQARHSDTCPKCGAHMEDVTVSGDKLRAKCAACGWLGTKTKTSAKIGQGGIGLAPDVLPGPDTWDDVGTCQRCGADLTYNGMSWVDDRGFVSCPEGGGHNPYDDRIASLRVASQRYQVAKDVVANGIFGQDGEPKKLEGAMLDLGTASLMVRVYESLSAEGQAKFDSVPLQKLVDFCWKNSTFGSKTAGDAPPWLNKGDGEKKEEAPEPNKPPAQEEAPFEPGQAVTLNYTLANGTTGSLPGTFKSIQGAELYFECETGEFAVTKQGDSYVDSAGTTFTIEASEQTEGQPAEQVQQPAQQPPVQASRTAANPYMPGAGNPYTQTPTRPDDAAGGTPTTTNESLTSQPLTTRPRQQPGADAPGVANPDTPPIEPGGYDPNNVTQGFAALVREAEAFLAESGGK